MNIERAEEIIDTMYQNKMSQMEEKTTNGLLIHTGTKVEFTEEEKASVTLLRELQILKRKLANSIPKSKVKEKIEELKIDRNAIKKEIEEAKKEKNKEYYADLLGHLQVNYGEKKALSELMED